MNNEMLGIDESLVTLTPERAKRWIEKNTMNRPPRKKSIRFLADQIKRGLWKYNGAPIIFDDNGWMLDGQHRCLAVMAANTPIVVKVLRGLSRDVFSTIDTGISRSGRDTLAVSGVKNYTLVCTGLRHVHEYDNGDLWNRHNVRISNQDYLVLLEQYPRMEEIASVVAGYPKGLCVKSTLMLTRYVTDRISSVESEEFFRRLLVGDGLNKGDALLLLRNRLTLNAGSKSKLSQRDIVALIFKAWNFYRSGKKGIGILIWRSSGETKECFPVPV